MVIVKLTSRKTGNPVQGKQVTIGNNALLNYGLSNRQSTNAKGEVEFQNFTPCSNGEIYIDGKSVYKGKIQDVMQIHID